MEGLKKILFINFGGIGDEILFLPSVISVKKQFPNAEITLALEPRSKGIKDLTNIIDDLIFVDIKNKNKYFEILNLIFKARQKKFDAVISAGGNKFISIILFLTGIKTKIGYNTGKLSQILLTHAVKLNKQLYAVKMYHDLVKPLTMIQTDLPQINIEQKEKISNSILIHPGVSKMSIQKNCIKTIPSKTWAKVIDILAAEGKKVILTGGPDDKECIEEILENVRTKNFENLYGTTKNLSELAQMISSAEKFLCSDSAPLHIAVSLGVKTYVIFGPTNDKVLIPASDSVIAIKADDNCNLKPCLWEKRQTSCQNPICLKISAQKIAQTVLTK